MAELKFQIQEEAEIGTRIKVIGVGGGGCNAVARMMNAGMQGVEFYVLNTDMQALQASPVPNKLPIGGKITKGLGAGANPEIGRQAAMEDTNRIIEILEDADMVFITSGLGGGTGTGATPIVASLARELGALTVAVVTKPFSFEGPRRMKQAEQGLAEIAGVVDTVISIPNDKLLKLAGKNTSFQEALQMADDVLRQAVQGIADIITTPGIINRDFSDIRAIMSGMGYAMMGTATATGEDAAIEAARLAINSPLLEEGGVEGARGILINITGSSRLGLLEVSEACTLVREATQNDDVQISFGVVADESMDETVKLTVIATGFERQTLPQIQRRKSAGSQPIAVDPALFMELPTPPPPIAPIEREPFSETELDTPEAEWVAPPQAAEPATAEAPKPADPFDDVDTPAFLRRERRLFR
ncbi:MAG: cell division protein FtsZ [Acidobacteria bacterium]|nr:cell division protein FtsZ [Acidobacteriota bacterium]